MKTNRLLIALTFLSFCAGISSQTVVVTDDPAYTTGDASSVLDIKSTTKGLLIPRVTLTANLGSPLPVTSPATGLLVYNEGANQPLGFYYWNGTTWDMLVTGTGNFVDLTSNQTIGGVKTFSLLPVFSSLTQGSVLFASAGGQIAQNNANFFWDNTNNRLGIGTGSPVNKLTIGDANQEAISRDIQTGKLAIMGGTSEATGAYFQITGDQNTTSPYEGSAEFVIRNLARSQFALFSYDGASTWNQRLQLMGQNGNTFLVPNGGVVGVGLATSVTPTAILHLKAGTATANTAPLKFTSGTNLTTPEAGAVEYDGTNYYVSNAGTRYTLAKTLTNTGFLNFPWTAAQNSSDLTISVPGAELGDVVVLGIPNGSTNTNSTFTAWVSSSGNVTVRFNNYSTVGRNPAGDTFRVSVLKY